MLKEIFSQRLSTQSKTVNNAIITLGDIDDSGKGRKFKSRFLTPGIAGYPGQFGNVLIKKESFDKFIKTLEGAPVIINHKNLTEENADTARVGVVSNVWFNDKDGWYWCDGIIWDKTAQNLITEKGWSVSCSYDVKLADDTGGSENNIPYNIEFLDGVFTHLAIVNNPRYERANIVFNSKTEVINDKWITIHPNGEDSKGRHLLLKDGENVYEAMQRQWGISSPGQQHLFSVSKYKTDDNYKKELDAKIAELNKNIETSKRDEASKEAKKINDEWEYSDMPVSEYSAKAKRFEEKFGRPLAEVTRELRSKEASIKPHGKDSDDYRRIKLEDGETPKEAIERTYGKEEQREKINQPSLSIAEAKDRAKKIGVKIAKYDDFTPEIADAINEAILTLPKEDIPDYVTSFKEAERLAELTGETKERARKSFGLSWNYPAYRKKDDNTYINTDTNVYFNQKYKKLEQISKKKKDYNNSREKPWYFNTDGKSVFYHEIGHQYERKHGLDDEFKKLADDWANSTKYQNIKKIEYGRIKEGAGANYKEAFAEAWAAYHTQNKELPKNVRDYMHRLNSQIKKTAQNNKEQDMALIDELKKLITKVENDKGEDMDDKEKVENEKVDKRKLIDEVAGIMKSAGADDEKIRTAIAKMEKLAYDKSEAGTADNEKEDELKEDKPADNSKIKNEESKEDEKKYDDLKKDVKEDVENKCKNSVDNAKGGYFDKMNEIYNAATQPAEENTYISREQKLKYAEEYFAK